MKVVGLFLLQMRNLNRLSRKRRETQVTIEQRQGTNTAEKDRAQ